MGADEGRMEAETMERQLLRFFDISRLINTTTWRDYNFTHWKLKGFNQRLDTFADLSFDIIIDYADMYLDDCFAI